MHFQAEETDMNPQPVEFGLGRLCAIGAVHGVAGPAVLLGAMLWNGGIQRGAYAGVGYLLVFLCGVVLACVLFVIRYSNRLRSSWRATVSGAALGAGAVPVLIMIGFMADPNALGRSGTVCAVFGYSATAIGVAIALTVIFHMIAKVFVRIRS